MVQRATDAGSLAYLLVKPPDIEQLVPAVQSALKRAEEMRQLKESSVRALLALVCLQG